MIKAAAASAVLLAAAGLAGCSEKVHAPVDPGVCWHVVFDKQGTPKFNKLASDAPNLETCAVHLERLRIRFRSIGGAEDVIGAYQGQFLFVEPIGVRSAASLEGGRYIALVRGQDGRLLIPGQPPRQ